MDFSLGNGNQSSFGTPGAYSGANSLLGPDLEDIQTEALGFLALGGAAKVQLLPTAWPSDNLPPPTASLMSIASQKGLVAAAGPDAVIVASTESVRKAFGAPRSGDGEVRPFQPQLTLPMPMRISQVAFTADEKFLVLSAENGGGLAVYEVQNLLNGSTKSSFEMPTNSSSLRALVPNPTPERGEFLAIVTTDGKFMIANLKEKSFISGANGQILKEGVSCVSWSKKGAQVIAGLGNGSAHQMTPSGVSKGEIPNAPGLDQTNYLSSITWLENDVFLTVSTPTSFDSNSPPDSTFHLVTRPNQKSGLQGPFTFQKIADPVMPFGLARYPPQHFFLRLRDFPPNLDDLLIVASSASTDIGLFSKSTSPLTSDKPSDTVVGVFTNTELPDSQRAQLPTTADHGDTSPIGIALDLSSREKVIKPIPTDEMDESPMPAPALMVLNNEGILASWWFIYSESVKQSTIYPGMIAASEADHTMSVTSKQGISASGFPASDGSFTAPKLGISSNQPSAFSSFKPAEGPKFESVSGSSGTPGSLFGATSGLGQSSSPWGSSGSSSMVKTANSFGSTTFGSASAPNAQGLTIGTPAALGNRPSPWAAASTTTPGAAFGQPSTPGTAFGQPSMPGNQKVSAFASAMSTGGGSFGSGSGFASFANGNGFASVAAAPGTGGSVFGSKPASGGFAAPLGGSDMESGSMFGSNDSKDGDKPGALFGSTGFTLGTTFKLDASSKDDGPKPANNGGNPFFESAFGSALSQAQKTPINATPIFDDADMDADEPEVQQKSDKEEFLQSNTPSLANPEVPPSTTPMSTPAGSKFQFPTTAPSTKGDLFGTSTTFADSIMKLDASKSAGFAFDIAQKDASSNSEPSASTGPEKPVVPVAAPTTPEAPKIKQEQADEEAERRIDTIPEAPLPPDPTSKASYPTGESSVSSVEPDAPLPPDFITAAAPKKTVETFPSLPKDKNTESSRSDPMPSSEVPSVPEDDNNSDFGIEDGADESEVGSEEGSGEDIANDISPTSGSQQTPGFTPQSSFGGANARGTDGLFTKIPRPAQEVNSRSLFGEISSHMAPIIPPPKPQLSPRSPSPIRNPIHGRLLRPDANRSVSAPGFATELLGSQRMSASRLAGPSNGSLTASLEQRQAEDRRRAEARERKEAEETQALIDREDESIQKFLNQEIVGTKILDDFIAHQDYVGNADKDSIPAQVEAVYRDINSMIDTLGINSCALKSFIKGHEEQYKESGRVQSGLEDDDWCLVEMKNLSTIVQGDLTQKLDQGRVENVASKIEACVELEKDLSKLRAKHEDLKTLFTANSDPDYIAVTRSQPLSAEQAVQQHDLRKDFTKLQQLLSEAEENLTLLRTKLASQGLMNGSVTPGPTVEAVIRTITKMTQMAEKRSGDIDVLENQMRKLRLGSTASNDRSREGSPFATPASKSSTRNPGASNSHSLFYTPDSTKDTPRAFQASLASSTQSYSRVSPSPRKKMSGFTEEDKQRLKANASRRKEVTDRLRTALQKNSVRVRPVDLD